MVSLEINWINESIRIDNYDKNTYAIIRFSKIDLDKWLDQNEDNGDLNKMYRLAVERMLDNDLINMRDNETGEEI